MKCNLINIQFLSIILISCSLSFTQPTSAQGDSVNMSAAKISLIFLGKDSSKQVRAVLTKPGSNGKDTAVKNVEIHFYISRSFGLLPIEGDNLTTDENGEATVDFPNDIPGDTYGNVIVIAKVEDNDALGNIESQKKVQWGLPSTTGPTVQPRALWATGNNAPWPLVITVTTMVVIVWGVIFYILIQLIAIKKASTIKN